MLEGYQLNHVDVNKQFNHQLNEFPAWEAACAGTGESKFIFPSFSIIYTTRQAAANQPRPIFKLGEVLQMALTTTQLQVVKALVAGSTIKDAAHAAGVHRSTVHEWISVHPEFRAALDSARNHFARATEDDLRSLAEAATSLLRKMIEDESAPPHLRLRAELTVLERVQSACPPVRNGETRFEQTMNAAIETAHGGASSTRRSPSRLRWRHSLSRRRSRAPTRRQCSETDTIRQNPTLWTTLPPVRIHADRRPYVANNRETTTNARPQDCGLSDSACLRKPAQSVVGGIDTIRQNPTHLGTLPLFPDSAVRVCDMKVELGGILAEP